MASEVSNKVPRAEVRRNDGAIAHGAWLDSDDWQVPNWVRQAIGAQISTRRALCGEVERGNEPAWTWRNRDYIAAQHTPAMQRRSVILSERQD